MKFKHALCFVILLAVLSNCATKEEEKEQEAKEEQTKEEKAAEAKAAVDTYKPHLICPQVAIIRELETLKDYGGDKGGQLAATAHMKNITGTCSYQDEGIDIAFTLNFTATKGPRLAADQIHYPFFIAVVDPDQSILNKNQMSVGFEFKSDDATTTHDEPMHVFIPLPKDKNAAGPSYRVLAGFQLAQDQLNEVRAHSNAAVGLPAGTPTHKP